MDLMLTIDPENSLQSTFYFICTETNLLGFTHQDNHGVSPLHFKPYVSTVEMDRKMESYKEEHIEGLENLSINCQVRESEMSWTFPGFFQTKGGGGVPPTPNVGAPTYYLAKISRKLHENEGNWTRGGGGGGVLHFQWSFTVSPECKDKLCCDGKKLKSDIDSYSGDP